MRITVTEWDFHTLVRALTIAHDSAIAEVKKARKNKDTTTCAEYAMIAVDYQMLKERIMEQMPVGARIEQTAESKKP